ncbi:MAG TPA: SDR family oxidoreductase [Tepidisphaeraceae bacterium]|jgi:NAD(P)-dependent dehydrogenase (short-subunit alcohol dehydrogenase family)
MSNQRFAGRVALITGAGSGIGEAAAMRLASEGARIIAVDRNESKLTKLLSSLGGGGHIQLTRDLRVEENAKSLVADCMKQTQRIDIVVNAAGVCHFRPMKDIDVEEWDEVLEINLRALFQVATAAAEAMDPARGGRIVNLGSNAGRKGRALSAHYAASKAAVANLTESLALSYGKKNITANTVCPAVTDTPMWEGLFSELHAATGKSRQDLTDGWTKLTPLGRLGTPTDVANLIAFLVSNEASFITGQTINVCGGFMLTC